MTVPEAVEVAKKHLVSILPDLAGAYLQLEELEAPPYGSKWSFTFSAMLPTGGGPASTLSEVLRGRRVSKAVQLDSETGALISVKNAA